MEQPQNIEQPRNPEFTAETSLPPHTGDKQPAPSAAAPLESAVFARQPLFASLRPVFTLALPTIAVLVAQTAVNIAEAYYIGLLGIDALAGAALVFPLLMLMTMMSNGGMGSGVASAIARARGAGQHTKANELVFHTLLIALALGAAFSAAVILGGPWMYAALGGKDGSLQSAILYSNYLFAGSITVWVVNLLAAALRGAGDARTPAKIIMIGALVTIPASPALIFGFGPIPRLGIAGAGLAFALYYAAAAVVMLTLLGSGRSVLLLRPSRLQWRRFADILKVGFPSAVGTGLTNLTVVLVTGAAAVFGTGALAGYGIASRLDYLLIPLVFGWASAVLAIVGRHVGAGAGRLARRTALASTLAAFLAVECVGLLVAVAPWLWTGMFTDDAEVAAQAGEYLRIVGPFYGLMAVGMVASFAAQGAGRPLLPFLGIVARLAVAAGGGVVAVRSFGVSFAGLCAFVSASLVTYALVCAAAMALPRFWSKG